MTHPSDDRLEEVALRLLRLDSNPLSAPAEGAATLRACKRRGALQPIETAPKDGAWVLLCGGEVEYGWCGNEQPPAVVGQWVSGASVWQFAWYDSGFYGEYENPTHWAPLSDTPDTDTQAAERRGWNAAIEAAYRAGHRAGQTYSTEVLTQGEGWAAYLSALQKDHPHD